MAPLILISSEANSGLSLLAKVINMTEQNQDKKQTYNFNKLQKRLAVMLAMQLLILA